MRNPLIYPMLALLWLYKYTLSPTLTYFGIRCRHTPSCSDYSKYAIAQHGPWAGGWMTLARLSRCHWFGTSGVDNVPEIAKTPPFWAPWRYGLWRGTHRED